MDKIFKHLKLDKFVGGEQQRIFKTTTNITQLKSNNQIINKKGKSKNVYYGNLQEQSQKKQLQSNLIDFHQINYDYLYNRPDKLKVTTIYNDSYNPTFTISANIVKNFSTEQDNQRISYFPQYLYTPIDICKYNNSYYMLLPISTNRFINIAHPDEIKRQTSKLQNLPFGRWKAYDVYDKVPFKQSYTEAISAFYDKPAYTSQDNNIPVYDLHFKNLQTIKFDSSQEVFQWILTWGFQNIIYKKGDKFVSLLNEILYDSTNQKFYDDKIQQLDNYDSICLPPLINYLTEKYYLYNPETIISIISDLISNLTKGSFIRFFNPIGKINSIQKQLEENVLLSSNLITNLNNENIFNIKHLLEKQQQVAFDNKCLPQNTLLVGNSLYPLYNSESKYEFPSCYVNLLHLKNTRDPEYQIDFSLNEEIFNNKLEIQKDGYISSALTGNYPFEYDGRFSIQYNNGTVSSANQTLTKKVTQNILDYAVNKDTELASSNVGYTQLFPQRLSIKEFNYMAQYNNKNITANKIFNAGTLNGFRNYIHVESNSNNNSWLSYHYLTDKNDSSLFQQNYNLPFYSYNLNRDQQWIEDSFGNNLSSTIMKNAGFECPWTEKQQTFMGCTLQKGKKCTGFCTFPCHKKQRAMNHQGIPNDVMGLNWNLDEYVIKNNKKNVDLNNDINITINKQYFIIPSSSFDKILKAETDIKICDDMQVFFISGIVDDISFKNIIENITEQQEFKSIFNGFGKTSISSDIISTNIYPQIMYVNQVSDNGIEIASNSKFNGPHIIPKDFQIVGYDLDTNTPNSKIIKAGQFTLIKIKNWWSENVSCSGIIKTEIYENNTKQTEVLKNVTNMINNYQFIQTLDGFYKFKQHGLHKSNIYSINLSNTGLNPDYDKSLTYYTKLQLINIFQQKYYIKYYQNQDNFLLATEQNLFIFTKYYSHNNDNKFCKTPLFKYLYNKYNLSNMKNLTGFILMLKTITFNELVIIEGYESIIDEDTNQILYYSHEEKNIVDGYNNTRQNIRSLIEEAIKNSILKYMPADTNLWKIKYTGD